MSVFHGKTIAMGVSRFEVVLDEEIYHGGSPISGKIYLDLDSSLKVRGIEIRYKGEGNVRWKHEGSGTHTCKATESYLRERSYIYGNGEDESEIPEGNHVFPFNWNLPSNIPCSFESFYGKIRYSIKAVVDRPWKFDYAIKVPFTVAPILDLNSIPLAREPVSEENSKVFGGSSETLTMTVLLPVRGYVSGQTIPVRVKLQNQSKVAVEKVHIFLEKDITYHAGEDHITRKEVVVEMKLNVIEEHGEGLIGKFRVPPLPPSIMPHSSIIDVSYKIKVEAQVEGWFHKNLKVKTDILIGTIPLLSYELPRRLSRSSRQSSMAETVEDIEVEDSVDTSDAHRSASKIFYSHQESAETPEDHEERVRSLARPAYHRCPNTRVAKIVEEELGRPSESDSDEEIASSFYPRYPVYEFFDSLFLEDSE
ncbi:arrestin domain-containing protein 17 [Cephus cinctus]|uniref:Arrestin domain-containing protein 17 n=1 Tax=Cephus cinctus TaxID=211228 RepID=A0AAJ7RQM0_CEPCN|nr:arrestin domain-containing protein 17 [Cephus cinctus]